MEPDDPLATLTDAEKEVLRLFLVHSDTSLIGRAIDRSVHAVEQRLKSARRKLGVTRSLDAALLLARAEGAPAYQMAELRPSVAGGPPVTPANPAVEGGWSMLLPLPTKGRPWNNLPAWTRLAWILFGMFAVAISTLAIVNVAETLSRLSRHQ